jgi:hypothetical protein
MSSIFHVIEEEFERLNEAMLAYKAAINREELGAPQIKRVGRKNYLYLARRRGKKVKFRYVGNVEDKNARKVLDSVKKRREYEILLKGIKSDLKEVRKALRGRKI